MKWRGKDGQEHILHLQVTAEVQHSPK